MRGRRGMFGSGKRIFAGKQRLHEEPFCPFVTNDTGYQDLRRNRGAAPYNPGGMGNTGSFGPVSEYSQKHPNNKRFVPWW